MCNVFEHISDPVRTFCRFAHSYKSGGTVTINVHNINSWQSRLFGSSWSHLDPPRHLFHFEPKSMEFLLNKPGLKMNGIRYDSIEFDPFGWLLSSINKITGRYNYFARYLMGLEQISVKPSLYLIFSILLTIPSILISYLSYIKKRGALMQVSAKHL